jgi:ATP-dependent helicase/nuclease subunit B
MIDHPISESRPRVFNIPTGLSFVDALADGLVRQVSGDPLRLASMTVLLPNRRACRALQEAFLRTTPFAGSEVTERRALFLPRLRPIGDVDEDDLTVLSAAGTSLDLPPAIDPLRRQLLLARLVMASRPRFQPEGEALRWQDAVRLAADLGRLLDQTETERCDLANLDRLVLGDLARHWQLTVDFLSILRDAWPAILRGEGASDVAARRNLLLEHQTELWRKNPPAGPVIAAGSTGSIPASADLIALVAHLPQGSVVLPGLDCDLDAEAWAQVAQDPSHPQFGLSLLLTHIGLERKDVRDWPQGSMVADAMQQRRQIVSGAMLPAECTDRWSETTGRPSTEAAAGAWRDVRRLDCRNRAEEAGVIALILRRHVEEPGDRRAALVTPDRQLAAQVAAELRRWNIIIDDSAGHALNLTPPGAFFLLLAEAAAADWAPVELLSVLKHPLAAAGLAPVTLRHLVRDLERGLLRGPRPAPGWDGLRAALLASVESQQISPHRATRLVGLIDRLAAIGTAVADWHQDITLQQRLTAHLQMLEALAADDVTAGANRLWREEAGESLADFCHRLAEAAAGQPAIGAEDYAALLAELMESVDVRPRYGTHPRLFIWGPLEARLQQVELMVLGGLNEGTWPAALTIDPWLNRPMRQAFGLPQPERRVGLSAHDFQQALGATQVYLTRAGRIDGTPTVPSRWLLRLDAYLRCLGLSMTAAAADPWQAWQGLLDRPAVIAACGRPAPQPGLKYRPNSLSVTGIETWMRDPYAIYARHILKLRALDPLDADPSPADLGNVIHEALEHFIADCRDGVPPNALVKLLAHGERSFAKLQDRPAIRAFWWPRFQRIAAWVVAEEEARRPQIARSFTEISATLAIDGIQPGFDLRARADRIDQRKDGTLAIIDYKTGAIPSMHDVNQGFAPQLPLEAALTQRGAFKSDDGTSLQGPVAELAFWQLTGSDSGGVKPIRAAGRGKAADIDYGTLAGMAYDGLLALLQEYSREEASYPARPAATYAPRYSDYQHLARVLEWSLSGEAGE